MSRAIRRARPAAGALIVVMVASVLPWAPPPPVEAATLPSGFTESVAFGGLVNPTVVRFSPDGRVFVAEKAGLIKVFDSMSDTTPSTFADLRTQVADFWDRGMLGMALHPSFPTVPEIFVAYTRDAEIGGTAPRWNDGCPTPPGPTGDGCIVSSRVSMLPAGGSQAGAEVRLVDDWCQQYPSHSIGSLQFGPDGALYVSGGDGASYDFADYGQDGSAAEPVRRPAGRGRGHAHASDGGGGRPSQPGPAHPQRSHHARRHGDPAARPDDGRGNGGKSAHLEQ